MRDNDGTWPIEISVADLAAALKNKSNPDSPKITVLDVREHVEIEICALPEYIHIPLMDVPHEFSTLPRDHALVVICHHGMRSGQAVGFLRQQGFENAINLQGGIDAWAHQIDPSMATY